MDSQAPPRPRVSRETRLLFITVIASVVALWVLARLRFPERPAPVNPVAPVLTQLAPTPAFSDLAAVVTDVQSRVLAPFVAVPLQTTFGGIPGGPSAGAIAALRVREDVAIALLDPSPAATVAGTPLDASVINVDPATGLAAIRVPALRSVEPAPWDPRDLQSPRYMLSTMATREGLTLRPVFVSTLEPIASAPWRATLWTAPPGTDLTPGSFAFTSTGALAGLVVWNSDRPGVLPLPVLRAAADRLIEQGRIRPGWIGLTVQALTPALALATGAPGGVIVTWVDPAGPAAGSLEVGDVLEAIDGERATLTEQQWMARAARLAPGDSITIRVRRGEMIQPVRLTAAEHPARPPELGLGLRRVRAGVEVLRVEPGSAAAQAGIRAGDTITFAAGIKAPTPAQITRAFATAGRPVALGITRGDAHFIVAVAAR